MLDRMTYEVDVIIADGQSVSGEAVVIGPYTMFQVFVPTGVAGSHLQALEDKGGSPKVAKDDVSALKIVAFTPDQWVDLPPSCATMHKMYLKTCSAADGTPQTQSGGKTLTLRAKG